MVAALLLAGCFESVTTVDAGVETDAGPRVCEEPSVRVLLRTDYVAGDEVVSVILEANDMVVGGRGVTSSDDLSTGYEVGVVCAVRPGTRILVRLRDGRGIELAARLVVVDSAATAEVVVTITR